MNAKEKTTRNPILLEIANKLTKAQQEIEEFTAQLALGEAEVKDKFEALKANFKHRLDELKAKFDFVNKEDMLVAKIIELESLIQEGQVKDKSGFEKQKDKIMNALSALEFEVSKRFKNMPAIHDFIHELEKFKLKLEIVKLKFGLKKFEVKEGFRLGFDTAGKKIDAIVAKAAHKVKSEKSKYVDFGNEIKSAYKHFRKAVDAIST